MGDRQSSIPTKTLREPEGAYAFMDSRSSLPHSRVPPQLVPDQRIYLNGKIWGSGKRGAVSLFWQGSAKRQAVATFPHARGLRAFVAVIVPSLMLRPLRISSSIA